MSASISMKKKTVGMDFLKRTTGIITGATGAYISEVMPVTTSTLSEAKNTVSSVSAAFANTSQAVLPKIRQLRTQVTFRGINNWFMGKEDDYSDFGVNDSNLSFDVSTDPADIAEAQVSELGRNANQISQAVVESSHKMVESQLAATANLMNTAEKQTAVITAGFDRTNETLNKILEVLTKNTSTLIETSVANSKRSANDEMAGSGKFNLSEYKKIISGNFKNSQLGTMATLIPAMLGDKEMIKQFLSPESVTQMLIGAIVNKKSPNLKKNMKALDDAINETVMTSLIRLGENDSYGLKGQIAKMFGIDSKRKETNTSRSTLELKTVPFDSIAHESLTNAIPGYLRKILVAVGGPDEVYDYRSRSFRTKTSIRKDFHDTAATKGNLYGASGKVRDAMGTDQFSNMVYDMMMSELGSRTSGGSARRTVDNFGNQKDTRDYILNTVLKGVNLTRAEQNATRQISKNLGDASSGMGGIDIMNQVARNNVNRNTRMSQYVDGANAYNIDLSDIRDSVGSDLKNIAESYGKRRKSDTSNSSVSGKENRTGELSGQNYTNIALFEIYRKLNKGINVFQVGANQRQSDPFVNYGEKYLQKPQNYRTKPMMDNTSTRESLVTRATGGSDLSGEANLLRNQQLEDGSTEELSGGQRFARWGKNRGGNLARALFSGSPEQVKDAFTLMFRDVGQVAGDGVKRGAAKLNESSGNFGGYLKHKITGAGYKYKDEDGNDVVIDKNDKGGVLGYFDELIFGDGGANGLMKRTTSTGSKWFKSIAGYFNYGSKDPDEQKVAGKRKTILGTSVGAMLGMGILGGPLGILMGGIAGSAISQTDGIGAKLKNILFGDKDHEGDRKKDRNKRRGLIGRAVDGIVDPIRYQIGKTMTTFGSVLKKNILGPLSNIGYAIKDRMSNAAAGVVSKVFGKIFGGAFNILKKVIMLPLNIAKAPISAIGGLTRGAAEGGGAMVGGFLNSIASGIATKDGRSGLKDRRQTQRRDANIDKAESGFYGDYEFDYEQDPNGPRGRMIKTAKKISKGRDYKTWKASEDDRRDKMGNINKYTEERRLTKEEIEAAEAAKRTAENTAKQAEQGATVAEDLHGLAVEGLTRGSIFTHDDGLHQRLDQLIQIFSGNKKGSIKNESGFKFGIGDSESNKIASSISNSTENSDIDSFASGAIGAAANFASSGDDVTNDESRLVTGIIDESQKDKANKRTIGAHLKDLMGSQKKKLSEATEKKETIFDKIFGFLGNAGGILKSLLPLVGVVAALVALFKNGGLKDLLDRLGFGVDKFLGLVEGEDKDGQSATTVGMNTVTSLADVQAQSSWDYANPLSTLFHNQKDAAGNMIENNSATEAKNELLWKMPLRKDLLGGTWNTLRASSKLNLADTLDQKATAQRAAGGLWNNTKAKVNEMRSDQALRQSLAAEDAAAAPKTNTISSIGRAAGRIGVINVAGGAAGSVAGSIASGLGADEETSASVSRITNAATSGALTVNTVKSAVTPGKKAWVDKIIDGITSLLKMFGEKIGADKAFKAIGSSKVMSTITGITSKITKGIAGKIDDVIIGEIVAKLTALGVKNAATVATAGLAIAAGALVGLASGLCGVEHLFQVLPGDADAGMKTISAVFGTVFGALEMTPAGWIIAILDVIDAILVAIPGIGIGVKQMLAQGLYRLLGGDANLSEKQAAFETERKYTEETYGVKMNSATMNDEINSYGLLDKMWDGGASIGDDGHINRDAAGSAIKGGGIKGLFVGAEKKYATDANGAVLEDENGTAIQATDKYGNKMKEDKKWGDHVGGFFGGVGRFFGGGTVYKTDENGVAVIGEDGKAVVESKEGNIFERGGAAVSNWWNGQEVVGPDGKKTKTDGFVDATKKTLGGIGSAIAQPFKDVGSAISGWFKGKDELDEKGKPISDENGKTVRKGKMSDFIKQSLGKITSSIMGPVKEMSKGVTDWVSKEAPWLADGVKNAADWIGSKASSIWNGLTGKNKNNLYSGATPYASGLQRSSYYALGGGSVNEPHSDTESSPIPGVGKPHSATESAPSPTSRTSTGATISPFIGSSYNYSVPSDSASCDYGPRNLWGKQDYHTGIDLAPTSGDWSVGAISPATVTKVSNSVTSTKGGGGYGNLVEYQLPDGTKILNAHLAPNSIPSGIAPGAALVPGDKIGTMGTTGNSSGPHLHFEARNDSVTDDVGGHSFDPSSLIGMSTVSDTGNYTSGGTSLSNTSSVFGTENTDSSVSDNTNKGPLGILIDSLKNLGSRFLSVITGGLLGDSLAGSPSSTDPNAPTINYGDYSQYTGTCENVAEFLRMCAKEIGTSESPADSNKTKYGEWYNLNGVAWCMIFVQWCFAQAGLALEYKSASCSDTLEWWTANHPDRVTSNPKPGDIMIMGKYSHTGIVEKVNGTSVTTIEGNTSPSDKGSQNNGGCVARKERPFSDIKKFIRPVDFEALSQQIKNKSSGAMPSDLGEGAEALWQYFKGLGYNDEAIAGILGCWTAESGNKARTIESEHLPGFPGYDQLINNRQAMNDYTQRVVFTKTKGVNQKWYRGKDGNLYPGIGLAQWTGERGESLLKFAKQNNADWGTMATQLGYLDTELNSGYKNVKSHIQGAKTPEEAAGIFCNEFEGYDGSGVSVRKTNARNLMAKYGGGKTGVGGNSSLTSSRRPTAKAINELNKEYNIQSTSGGIGGKSSIARTSFKTNIPQRSINIGGGPLDSAFSSRVRTNENINNIISEELYSGGENDLTRVIGLLTKIVSELTDINGNTGSSSSLLSSLNEKGFVDKGLRDSITAVGKNQKKQVNRHTGGNNNNVRTVAAMARP